MMRWNKAQVSVAIRSQKTEDNKQHPKGKDTNAKDFLLSIHQLKYWELISARLYEFPHVVQVTSTSQNSYAYVCALW